MVKDNYQCDYSAKVKECLNNCCAANLATICKHTGLDCGVVQKTLADMIEAGEIKELKPIEKNESEQKAGMRVSKQVDRVYFRIAHDDVSNIVKVERIINRHHSFRRRSGICHRGSLHDLPV